MCRDKIRSGTEPAWHRRLRKGRTRARTILRLFVSGQLDFRRHVVQRAVARLSSHHSRSALVLQARAKLGVSTMAPKKQQQAPYCGYCDLTGRKGAAFCSGCGWPFQATPYVAEHRQPSWQSNFSWNAQGRTGSQTPRRRRSPRARPKGEHQPGQPSNHGKGKPGGPKPPELQALPSAPPPPRLTTPSTSSTASGTSEAQARLDLLLSTLRSSKEALPADVVSMLGDQELLQSQMRSKALHQAVAMQTKSQTELLRVQEARRAYVAAWSDYTSKLQAVLAAQQTEQSKALNDFAEHEEKWKLQLKESTAALAKLSEDVQQVSSEEDDSNVDMKVVKEEARDPCKNRRDNTSTQGAPSGVAIRLGQGQGKGRVGVARAACQGAHSSTFGTRVSRVGGPYEGPGMSQKIMSGPFRASGVPQWTHSVVSLSDFVFPPFAQFLGLQTELEEVLFAQGFSNSAVWPDPRIDVDSADEDVYATQAWGACVAGSPSRVVPGSGARDHMDSTVSIESSRGFTRGVDGASSHAHHDSDGFLNCSSTCTVCRAFVHRQSVLHTSSLPYGADACWLPADHTHAAGHEAPYTVQRKGSTGPLRSCIRRGSGDKSGHKRVSFGFGVSFWFPAPSQLQLHHRQDMPACSSVAPHVVRSPVKSCNALLVDSCRAMEKIASSSFAESPKIGTSQGFWVPPDDLPSYRLGDHQPLCSS